MILVSTLASMLMALAAPHPIAIVGATLIDVSEQGRVESDVKDSVVLIAHERIRAVGERRQVRLQPDNADAFRLADRGKLETGRHADLVILTADPRLDVGSVDAIADVMVEGKFVDRARLIHRAVARPQAAHKTG
jgi:alpha-D-ribose 1-methylphosphonate 5-triphosphate diphosphatase PhnM